MTVQKHAVVAQVDEAELAVRMVEAASGMRRPAGASAGAALGAMDAVSRDLWVRAAKAGLAYVIACLEDARQVN